MDRDQHLAWCKQRAFEYLNRGDVKNAIASMGSDLLKHPETARVANSMLPLGLMYAMQNDLEGARHWIEGFR